MNGEAAREETVRRKTQNDEEITAERKRKQKTRPKKEYEESYESEIESVFCEGFDSSFKAYMDYRCITDTSLFSTKCNSRLILTAEVSEK